MSKTGDIRQDTAVAGKEFDEDLTKLWKLMQSADDETRKKIVNSLDANTIYLLRTKKNPFNKPVYKGNKNKILCFNVINLREKYAQRFAMTSLIGFLYRMLDEFEPPGAKSFESQNDAKFAKAFNPLHAAAIRRIPEDRYRAAVKRLRAEIEQAGPDTDPVKLKLTYHDLFVNQARLYQSIQHYLGEEKSALKLKLDMEIQELDRAKTILTTAERRLAVTRRKKNLKEIFDKTPDGIKNLEKLERDPVQHQRGEIPDYAYEDPVKCILTEFDKTVSLDTFDKIIQLRNHDIELIGRDITKLAANVESLQSQFDDLETRYKRYAAQSKQLRLDYNKQFKPESPHPLDNEFKPYELTDVEYDVVVQEAKKVAGLDKTREEYIEERRQIVQDFLDEYLVYNPDNHVQCAYKPNYEDSLRTPLKTAWIKYHETGDSEAYDQFLADHERKVQEYRVIKEAEYERKLVPPDDTFFRWQRYIDNNYEPLRQATDDIYAEKSDVEFSIVPLATFEGERDEIEMQAAEWQRKYAEEFEGDVYQATFGVHNMLGSWAQNRDRRDFYTKNSEILKRIIQQNEDDQKMGKRLMKERADKKRKENEAETGEHSSGLKEYRKQRHTGPTGLDAGGAKYMEDIDKTKSAIPDARRTVADRMVSELETIKDQQESTRDEVEVGWHNIRPDRRRGRVRAGKTESGKFHIATDKESPAQGFVMKPGDMHKHIGVTEMKEFVRSTNEDLEQ